MQRIKCDQTRAPCHASRVAKLVLRTEEEHARFLHLLLFVYFLQSVHMSSNVQMYNTIKLMSTKYLLYFTIGLWNDAKKIIETLIL